MNGHVFDDLPALLAGELDRDQTAAATAHLRACEECRHELVSTAAAAAALRSAARHAPVELAAPALPAPVATARTASRRSRWVWAGGAVAIAAAAVLAVVVLSGRSPSAPVRSVALAPVSSTTSGGGDVTMRAAARAETAMRVNATGLASPGSGYYEVWLLDPRTSKMLPVGVLAPSGGGTYELPDDVVGNYSAVDISLEADDGNPAHSADSVLRASY